CYFGLCTDTNFILNDKFSIETSSSRNSKSVNHYWIEYHGWFKNSMFRNLPLDIHNLTIGSIALIAHYDFYHPPCIIPIFHSDLNILFGLIINHIENDTSHSAVVASVSYPNLLIEMFTG